MERNRVLPILRVARCPCGWRDDSTQRDAKNSVSTEVEHQNSLDGSPDSDSVFTVQPVFVFLCATLVKASWVWSKSPDRS